MSLASALNDVPAVMSTVPDNAKLQWNGLTFMKRGDRWLSSQNGEELRRPFPTRTIMRIPGNQGTYISTPYGWLQAASVNGPSHYDETKVIKVVPHTVYAHPFIGDPEEIVCNIALNLVQSDWSRVANGEAFAFTGNINKKAKVSIRYMFQQWPDPKSEQVTFHRRGEPLTRGELAFIIAKQMKHHIIEQKKRNEPLMFDFGYGQVALKEVMLSDLVLISVKRASESSLQATLGVCTY